MATSVRALDELDLLPIKPKHTSRTVKSLTPKSYKVLEFIKQYQSEHDGKTPAQGTLNRELGMNWATGTSHIHFLEKAGLIKVDGDTPLKVIVVEQEPAPEKEKVKARRKARKKAAWYKTARLILTHIHDCVQKHHYQPTYMDMREQLGITNLANILKRAEDAGWLERPVRGRYVITELGLDQIGVRPEVEPEMQPDAEPTPDPVAEEATEAVETPPADPLAAEMQSIIDDQRALISDMAEELHKASDELSRARFSAHKEMSPADMIYFLINAGYTITRNV